MFRTLAECSELMSMAIIQKSPLRMSLAHTSTLRIQAQKGCMALSFCKAAAIGLAPRKHADVPMVYGCRDTFGLSCGGYSVPT